MTTLDPSALAAIETPEEAQAAFDLLEQLAIAVHESPGGGSLTKLIIKPLATDEMRALCNRAGTEIAVITHALGKLLRGEGTPADLRVIARKLVLLQHWEHESMATEAALRELPDAELGERMKALGVELYEAVSASGRSPGPAMPVEYGYKSDGY